MSLRYIVPTLGLLACSAPTFAADVGGGLSIDGYVDSILEITSHDEEARDGKDTPLPDGEDTSDTTVDFTSAFQIEPTWVIGDDVMAGAELYYGDGESSFALQQAYVSWSVTPEVTFTMGRFHNLIGWEGLDAPDLYRINNSNMYLAGEVSVDGDDDADVAMWGADMDGAVVSFAPEGSKFSGAFWISDYIYGEAGKDNTDLAFGATGTFADDDMGLLIDIDLAYDIGATLDDDGEQANAFGVSLNGEYTGIENFLFAFDFNFVDYDLDDMFGVLALANYAFPESSIPMSATFAINYLEPAGDEDDDEELEVAVALLTNPTNDGNFGLNGELRFIDRAEDDTSEFGIFVEALAVIP